MKILLLTLFAAAVSSSPLASCRWEEKQWCSSLKIAKECGAVQHCIETTWAAPLPNATGNDICQYCENIMKDVQDFITNNETEEKIQNFLDQACGVIPVSQMADECRSAVDNNLPEIFQMMRAELDPQMVCAAIGLCSGLKETQVIADSFFNAAMIQGVPNIQNLPTTTGDLCTDCKTFATDLMAKLASPAIEQEIEASIKESLCPLLGSMSAECEAMVELYLPELITLLSEEITPEELCMMFGVCGGGKQHRLRLTKMRLAKSPLYKYAQKIKSVEGCTLCKTVMTELQKMDRDKTTQAEVENFIKQELCAHLGSLEKECDETVDNYGPILFELLINELDPTSVCTSLGFCSASNSVEATVRSASPVNKVPNKAVKASAECVLCEFVMKEIDDLLKQNSSEGMIVKALDEVCSVLPDTIKESCTNFVNTYAPAIILLLAEELAPSEICTELGVCSAKSNNALQFKPVATPLKSQDISNGEMCGVCETVVQYIDSLLEENSTVQKVEALLDKVCNFLPVDLKSQCDDFIAQYGPAIIQLIAQFVDPKEFCTELGMCTAASDAIKQNMLELIALPEPQQQQLVGDKKCTWGPSYWCANKDNAKECKAEAHCAKHVWKGN